MKILFVCTGNTCRSPMAEALLRKAAADAGRQDIEVTSAGIMAYPGDPATPLAIEAVKTLGGSLARHQSRRVSSYLLHEVDLVLAMTTMQAQQLRLLDKDGKVRILLPYVGMTGDVDDPYGGNQELYDTIAGQIWQAMRRLVEIV